MTVTTPEKTAEEKKAETDRANRQDATNQRVAEANDRMATFTFYLVVIGVLQLAAAALAYGVARKSADTAHDSARIALAQKRLGDRQLTHLESQAEDMKRSIQEAAKSATAMERIAESMAISADSVRQSLAISKEIADTNRRMADDNAAAFITQNRALVHVIKFGIEWGETNPRIFLLLKNTGPQAAWIREWASGCVLSTLPPDPPGHTLVNYPNAGTVAPHDSATLEARINLVWHKDDWSELLRGKRHLSIWGIIRYETGFIHIPGETGFGFEFVHTAPHGSYGERFAMTDRLQLRQVEPRAAQSTLLALVTMQNEESFGETA